MTWTAEAVLTAIKNANVQCVQEADIVQITQLAPVQVEQACLKLRKHGLLEKTGQGCHSVTDAGMEAMQAGTKLRSGPKGRHVAPRLGANNTIRVKAWRAMRIRTKFSINDLAMLTAEGSEKNIISNLGKYVRALCKAGILVKLPKREAGSALTSNGFVRYWLRPENDTGPKAPIWRVSAKSVYDQNTEIEYSIDPKKEAASCG